MVVGIVDHQRGTRDVRRLPRPGPGWRRRARRRRRRRRRRWPASRCCSGSSPRRPTSRPSSTRAPAATLALAGLVVGSMLTAAYSIRFLAGVAGRLAGDGRRRRGARRPRAAGRRVPRPGRRPRRRQRRLRRRCPRLVDGLVGAAADALDRAVGAVHLAAVARLQHRAAALGGRPRRRRRAVRRPRPASARCSPRRAPACRRPPTPTSPRCAASTPAPTGSRPSPSPARCPSTSA